MCFAQTSPSFINNSISLLRLTVSSCKLQIKKARFISLSLFKQRDIASSNFCPYIKKARAWKYLFLSIKTYAFLTAALWCLGSVKFLCRNVCIALCYAELCVVFLNNWIKTFFRPETVYQNKQSMGSL